MRRLSIVAVPLLAVVAALLAVNAVIAGGETKAASASGSSRVLDLPGGDLNVTDRGPRDAPAILLVHCYTCSLAYWQRVEPLLRRDHRVIAVDLLGHGGSEKPQDGYSMAHQADTIARALDALGARPVVAVGQSLGGPVVTALAERHREHVRGLVIMDSSPRDDYVDLPWTADLARAPVIGPAIERVAPDGMIRDELGKAFAEGYAVPDEFVEAVRAMTFNSFRKAASDDYTDERALDDRIAATGLPVTVAFGAEDRIVDPAAADEYRDIPGAKVVVLPGVGHTPQMEAPARAAALIREVDRSTRRANDR